MTGYVIITLIVGYIINRMFWLYDDDDVNDEWDRINGRTPKKRPSGMSQEDAYKIAKALYDRETQARR